MNNKEKSKNRMSVSKNSFFQNNKNCGQIKIEKKVWEERRGDRRLLGSIVPSKKKAMPGLNHSQDKKFPLVCAGDIPRYTINPIYSKK